MPDATFDNDLFSRTLVRGLLLLQPTALVVVLGLCRLELYLPALVLSFLTFAIFVAVLAGLYHRYRKLPIVREKRNLEHLLNKFRGKVQAEAAVLREAARERERLLQAEKEESQSAAEREAIQVKFRALHDRNKALVKNTIASRQLLEHEIAVMKPRLRQLAPITFTGYLSRSLASRGWVAALMAFLLIVAQLVSSVGATGSALTASIPVTGRISTVAPAPAVPPTAVPADLQSLPTQTFTPAITETPAELPSATQTAAPSQTFTSQPSLPPSLAACIPGETIRETALVVGVVDGDTIDVRIADQIFRVRYIGVDTPERGEAFYEQATAYNQALVQDKTVTLIRDQSETDRFDRLLRYVIAGDVFVNQHLVEQGLAVAAAYPPDTACAGALEAAQVQAQTAKSGFWLPTLEAILPIPSVTAGNSSGVNCHPSYPGVCIPPAPPDLDCPQVSYTGFIVLPPDPHGFDRDHDGIGCEG